MIGPAGERLVRYATVSHDGRLFLCHRFVGDESYVIGDVAGGPGVRRAGGQRVIDDHAPIRFYARALQPLHIRLDSGGGDIGIRLDVVAVLQPQAFV